MPLRSPSAKLSFPVLLLTVLVAIASLSAQEATMDAAPIAVSDHAQLLIDHRFIASSRNVELRMNPPVKRGPVLVRDKPWEAGDIGFCVSVIPWQDAFHLFYMARGADGEIRHCYARSADGITWEKPNLGLIEYEGSKDTNIVLTGVVESTVFLDPVAPPEARFKTVSAMYWPDPERAGLYIHTSPDGLHWTMSDRRVFPLSPDTANQAFYDTRLGRYVADIRLWNPMRKVGRVEMDDITQPWPFTPSGKPYHIWGPASIPVSSTEVPTVFGYDEADPVPSDHYNAACIQYPFADDAYFMFPSAYRHFPEPPVGKYGNDGLLDIQMAVSRDGEHWTRLSRGPYVPLGLEGEVDWGQLYMAVGMVRSGPRLYQYYGGYDTTHGAPIQDDGAICRLEQRLDGFVSADFAYEGGELTTPPISFTGSALHLNLNASALGTGRVEILDEAGALIPGYALDDCDAIGGNSVDRTVTWRGQSDVSVLQGRAVQLRFVMRATKLYSFRFAA